MARPATRSLLIVAALVISLFGVDCGDGGSGESSSTVVDLDSTTTIQTAATSAPTSSAAQPTTTSASTTTTPRAARPAPDFAGTTLDGTQVSLASFRGKPLLLIFWASW